MSGSAEPDEPIRVVIADDQATAREALGALLRSFPGVEVAATAADGAEALVACRRFRPDVVIMDLWMPVMDGLQAMQAIKRRWPRTGVLVLTMFADMELPATESGADGFLLKGCRAEVLRSAIVRIAGTCRGRRGERQDA